ncbi:hypothetical protein CCP2SC5_90010 [Azospirillaceae bacterium]
MLRWEKAKTFPRGLHRSLLRVFVLLVVIYLINSIVVVYSVWHAYDAVSSLSESVLSSLKREEIRWMLSVILVLPLVFLLPVLLVFSILRFKVLLPLDVLTEAMNSLANGDTGVSIPNLDRRDEIGAMACAVEIFKKSAKQLQNEIKERRQLQDQINVLLGAVEHSPSAIIVTDTSGTIEYVNPKFCEITGYSRDEAVGKNTRFLSAGNTKPEVYVAMWKTIRAGLEWRGEFYNRKKNGDLFWQQTSIAPIRGGSSQEISHYVAVQEDVTARKDNEMRMWQQAYYDALTNLPNRALFDDRLRQGLARVQRNQEKLALLYLDLDRFKQVNDIWGHQVGDQVLGEVSERMKSCVRATDTVSRVGGDEFLILLTEILRDGEAADVATRIIYKLSQPFHVKSDVTINIGVSIGIAMCPRDGALSAILIKNADVAMYWGKSSGRNTFRFFSPDPNEHLDYYYD